MKHTFGSLFAGVGGFDLGMEAAGWDCRWQVEWDKQCQQVLRHHWPTVPKYGDVSTVSGHDLAPVDCITFGSPCQDLSVAGKRAGLVGERSGLFHEAVRIIEEMRDATESVWPRWAIWENVVGALSSNHGHDFAAVIDSLAEAGAVAIEWAVLDAQHFGVPQRRRRVFVIACFDPAAAARCPDPLLPVAESLPRDTAAKRTARQAAARSAAYGLGTDSGIAGTLGTFAGGGRTTDLDSVGAYVVDAPTDDVVGTLSGGGIQARTTGRTPTADCSYPSGVVNAVTSKWAKGTGGPAGDECQKLVAVWTKAKRAQSVDDDETWVEGQVAPTLNAFDQGDTRATVLAVAENQRNEISLTETMGALGQGGGKPGQGNATVLTAAAVRRLTPVECERLMGWPDHHTAVGVTENGDTVQLADSPRYRMIGNGVASPVAAWIGRHLLAVDGAE